MLFIIFASGREKKSHQQWSFALYKIVGGILLFSCPWGLVALFGASSQVMGGYTDIFLLEQCLFPVHSDPPVWDCIVVLSSEVSHRNYILEETYNSVLSSSQCASFPLVGADIQGISNYWSCFVLLLEMQCSCLVRPCLTGHHSRPLTPSRLLHCIRITIYFKGSNYMSWEKEMLKIFIQARNYLPSTQCESVSNTGTEACI